MIDWTTITITIPTGYGTEMKLTRWGNYVTCQAWTAFTSVPTDGVKDITETIPLGYRPQVGDAWMIGVPNKDTSSHMYWSFFPDGSIKLRKFGTGFDTSAAILGTTSWFTDDPMP